VTVSIIAAVAENGVIGRGGALPWRLPADMKYFRARTMGHHVVMGRKTWESIGRALPGRTNVIVSRNPDLAAAVQDCVVVDDLARAIELARAAGDDECFVIGGAELYAVALPLADRIYLTRIFADIAGDARFPALDPSVWVEVAREDHREGEPLPFAFCVLERAAPGD
jgi:dihydrofolate reductase